MNHGARRARESAERDRIDEWWNPSGPPGDSTRRTLVGWSPKRIPQGERREKKPTATPMEKFCLTTPMPLKMRYPLRSPCASRPNGSSSFCVSSFNATRINGHLTTVILPAQILG